MKTKRDDKVTLRLTLREAQALLYVAGNGWADGEFADHLGDKEDADAFLRAVRKCAAAMKKGGAQ